VPNVGSGIQHLSRFFRHPDPIPRGPAVRGREFTGSWLESPLAHRVLTADRRHIRDH
jgi:hypothetical protein